MATSKVDICARALVMIGAQPISSFTDGSTEALVASNVYEDILQASLTRHRWKFATNQKQLSLLSTAPVGRYEHAYQLPADPGVLQINTLTVNDYIIPYTRYKNMIYVNTYGAGHSLVLDYIYRVEEDYFPAHFRLALEYELASLFAGSVARDAGMINQFKQMSDRQFLISKNIDTAEVTTRKLDTSRFINLRNSTRTDV
jgi:hypothetical protein|tara:strand:- start:984 stop:1583 length:600 start_codon:yes stop_codon:yes gene_type:complete